MAVRPVANIANAQSDADLHDISGEWRFDLVECAAPGIVLTAVTQTQAPSADSVLKGNLMRWPPGLGWLDQTRPGYCQIWLLAVAQHEHYRILQVTLRR